MNTVTLKAYAKINLGLDITGKREDGYHLLKTVMQSVSLCDIITVSCCAGGISVSCDNKNIPADNSNIAYKAAERFFDATNISPEAEIIIQKHIPTEAGLGGGSVDAAAVLIALNILFGTKLSDEQLCNIGVTLGADVPFCIKGGTCLCEGIGEKLTPISTLTADNVVIAKGKDGVSTVTAYKNYDKLTGIVHPDIDKLVSKINAKEPYYSLCQNVFDSTVFLPEADEIRETMTEFGAHTACMTGSGSAVFGIFESASLAQKCKAELDKYVSFCDICSFSERGVGIE